MQGADENYCCDYQNLHNVDAEGAEFEVLAGDLFVAENVSCLPGDEEDDCGNAPGEDPGFYFFVGHAELMMDCMWVAISSLLSFLWNFSLVFEMTTLDDWPARVLMSWGNFFSCRWRRKGSAAAMPILGFRVKYFAFGRVTLGAFGRHASAHLFWAWKAVQRSDDPAIGMRVLIQKAM